MQEWLEQLLFGLIPGTCILCEARTQRHLDLCSGCERDLPRVSNPCRVCGLPLGVPAMQCGRCMVAPPPFQRCFAPFLYTWPVDRLINDFKNRNRIILGKVLAQAMARVWLTETSGAELPDTLLPVPLHKRRLRERGFNQSVEIAEVLADAAHVSMDNRLCRRVRDAAPQKSLNASQRRRNLRDAFVLNREPLGERVAIVDDVITTAATVSEIGRLLLSQGALQVEVIALARTPLAVGNVPANPTLW
jgi:ComF family protein